MSATYYHDGTVLTEPTSHAITALAPIDIIAAT